MAKPKPVTPYNRLLKAASNYANAVITRKRVAWRLWYPKESIEKRIAFTMDDLYEAALTADSLGYETLLIAKGDGMRVVHISKLPERPSEF